MCPPFPTQSTFDSAYELAGILSSVTGGQYSFSTKQIRALLKDDWDKIARLAHRIHDEECSEKKKLEAAIREVECLSVGTLKRVLEGNENPETIELVKYYAKKVLEK